MVYLDELLYWLDFIITFIITFIYIFLLTFDKFAQ